MCADPRASIAPAPRRRGGRGLAGDDAGSNAFKAIASNERPIRLESLNGGSTSHGPLSVASARVGRFPKECDLVLTAGGERAPVAAVKYFAGRAEAGVPPWIEAAIADDDETFLTEIVGALAEALPARGRLMIVHGDGETEQLLRRRVPPAATPVGAALLAAGCTWFKDWYFAEGGREGEAKLQGNKPPDATVAKSELGRVHESLRQWLDSVPREKDELLARARKRAQAALKAQELD